MIDQARLHALRVASCEVRDDVERRLAKLGEGISDAENEQLHDALASIKTVEALFSWLLGAYTPDPGTLIRAIETKLAKSPL